MKNRPSGSTLIKLIVVVFTWVLFPLAFSHPETYSHELDSIMSEVIKATESYRTGVELCYQHTNGFRCQETTGEIPPNITTRTGSVASLVVNPITGTITATAADIVPTVTYILTPTIQMVDGTLRLTWMTSGTCVVHDMC